MKTKLIEEVKAEAAKDRIELFAAVDYKETAQELYSSWQIAQYITPAYKSRKDLTASQLKDIIKKRYDKVKSKETEKKIQHIEDIFNAGEITEITVSIEWKANRTWGANPTAVADISGDKWERFISSSVSGWGYDKESTAFAEAINQSLAFNKLMYSNADKLADLYGHRGGSLSDGVGVSCYYRIFQALGYTMKKTGSGKTFDCYFIQKNNL